MTAELPGPVPPGTGWPEDPASPGTPVAHDAREVADLATSAPTLAELTARQSVCRACPRLVAWREQLAVERRKSFRTERYWGRPIPGWGAAEPRILIVGLAPAAHGGNRTGRIFTGDRSGDFLYAALYRCGLAAKPDSVTAGDGQRLIGARMVASVRCAPPDNKPTPAERLTCKPWLSTEMAMVANSVRVLICLGGFAWQALWPALAATGIVVPRPRPAFGHGVEVLLDRIPQSPGSAASAAEPAGGPAAGSAGTAGSATGPAGTAGAAASERRPMLLLGCYHPSQQNTFTGRVTPSMLDAVLTRAVTYAN